MATLKELQDTLRDLRDRKAVLVMLVEHIDQNFRSIAGNKPKLAVKTDEGNLVSEDALETVAQQLSEQIQGIDHQIHVVLEQTPEPAPA